MAAAEVPGVGGSPPWTTVGYRLCLYVLLATKSIVSNATHTNDRWTTGTASSPILSILTMILRNKTKKKINNHCTFYSDIILNVITYV